MEKIVLFDNKINCCGCGACVNVCPQKAIDMKEDECGFLYPRVDKKKCVGCKLCKKVCEYQNKMPQKQPVKVFAAVNKNESQLMNSASGGVFAAMAKLILESGGVVFGAALDFKNGHAIPHHIFIENEEELHRLQGSKYVQSSIGNTYVQAKKFLEQGRSVLFSGTPCQVAGLYGFLNKDYKNLITIDLICHGVPNAKFFDDYIQIENHRRRGKEVVGYSFRDKKKGWGMNGRIDIKDISGKIRKVYVPARVNSYNTLFLDGEIYRENCYECKYATRCRVGDLTIGDYWGIEQEHPELLGKYGFEEKKGISCILANSSKGILICERNSNMLQLNESIFSKVSNKNGQLKKPTQRKKSREEILKLYSKFGYEKIERWFRKKYKKQIITHFIYNKIPRSLRIKLKRIVKG